MRKLFVPLFVSFLFLFSCSPKENLKHSSLKQGIIPIPQKVIAYNHDLTLNPDFLILANSSEEQKIASILQKLLKKEGLELKITSKATEKAIVIRIKNTNNEYSKEAYELEINHDGIKINSDKPAGAFYAIQSIRQLLQKTSKGLSIQYCKITDYPTYAWRGLHLDVSRHFFDAEFIKKYIDNMSKYKLNTFHWHLTDDQGWRIEIKKYPKLTQIGSKRSETVVKKNFKPYVGDHKPYGGYYTQEEIKEVVKYAKAHFVTIVPEIEMPGHAQAALAAYPEYSCTGKRPQVWTRWGVTDTVYCPTDETFGFLEDVLDEVMELFPSKYIHIGGDEVPKAQWKKSAFCQKLMKKEGLQNEHELQSYFIQRIEKYVNSKGRNIIGWDEILEGGLAPNAAVMSWRGEKGGIAAANAGHNVVMTPGFALYFDHYQGDKDKEPFAIGGFSPLKKVYEYNPMPKQIDKDKQHFVMGVQANVWTEYMPNSKHVEYMVYPRALALSEIAWTNDSLKNWSDFKLRLKHNLELLKLDDVNFRPFDFVKEE